MKAQIVVFGAGAIGGFIAAALARAGESIGAVARGEHLEAMRREGLRVRSDLGEFSARFPVSHDLREFEDPEFVLVTFKSHQWKGVLPQFERIGRATIVTLQNGLPFWYFPDRSVRSVDPDGALRAAFPDERIIGGVVHASGNVPAAGEIHQSGGMLYPIGELDGTMRERTRTLSAVFERAGLKAPIESDIRYLVWRKLLGNLALNPVSALTRATVKRLLDDPAARALLRALIEEGMNVARACGVEMRFTAEERLELARHIADVKTSMLQDLEAGRALELEPIAGAVVELAAHFKIPVPHVETVYALTKMLEATL